MATVIANMSMSLDGFVADRNDDVGPLFDWYRAGPVTTPSADERWKYGTGEASAKVLSEALITIFADFSTSPKGGRPPSGRLPGRRGHAHCAGRLASGRRAVHLRDRWRRERIRQGQGDRRRQDR